VRHFISRRRIHGIISIMPPRHANWSILQVLHRSLHRRKQLQKQCQKKGATLCRIKERERLLTVQGKRSNKMKENPIVMKVTLTIEATKKQRM